MNMESFYQLEEKINKAVEVITRLKDEKRNLYESNQQLEQRVQHLVGELEHVRNENSEYRQRLEETSSISSEKEQQLREKIDNYIGKIDDVLGSEI